MYSRCTTIHISSNILAWLTTSYVTSSYQSFLDLLSTENNEVLYVWYARSCGMWGSDPLKVFHCVFLHVFKTSCWPFPIFLLGLLEQILSSILYSHSCNQGKHDHQQSSQQFKFGPILKCPIEHLWSAQLSIFTDIICSNSPFNSTWTFFL